MMMLQDHENPNALQGEVLTNELAAPTRAWKYEAKSLQELVGLYDAHPSSDQPDAEIRKKTNQPGELINLEGAKISRNNDIITDTISEYVWLRTRLLLWHRQARKTVAGFAKCHSEDIRPAPKCFSQRQSPGASKSKKSSVICYLSGWPR
ncbi:hypothetical protein PGTUg99_037556 [Puccinia graminis f. sp. tritici]|uniref:Uncharacterized protein n=1 Tax=Puccinia graminis f. sp. tritici TaxID=56615 RepID=A0A5B0SN27_PUCGR|nr:hypothetical protein PGTUg99_037556 [Puccinia graminis f. sp. tritici]